MPTTLFVYERVICFGEWKCKKQPLPHEPGIVWLVVQISIITAKALTPRQVPLGFGFPSRIGCRVDELLPVRFGFRVAHGAFFGKGTVEQGFRIGWSDFQRMAEAGNRRIIAS